MWELFNFSLARLTTFIEEQMHVKFMFYLA